MTNAESLWFVEQQYARYLADPNQVGDAWRRYFESWPKPNGQAAAWRAPIAEDDRPTPLAALSERMIAAAGERSDRVADTRRDADGAEAALLQKHVDLLIRNYRVRGHDFARVDPLGQPRPILPELEPATLGLTERDMDRVVDTEGIIAGPPRQTVRHVLQRLRRTYCRSIGAQFMHIHDTEVRIWLQERMESTENHANLDREKQLRILRRLTDAVVFEQFLRTKFVGAKTFSLEGAETLIPLMDMVIETAGEQGVDEVVIGMAHRGRLNVLVNAMGKSPQAVFREFKDLDPELYLGGGDVKYHLGFSSDRVTACGHELHLSLCFNPSHLEFINPVAMGRLRAKQERVGDFERRKGLVLLIHGDAAIIGEGVTQETLNLSRLDGYNIGGAVHVVVNNQIGFTTLPGQYRSCAYCTDVAMMLQSPVFHVNGEDPEAVAQVVRLAMEFHHRFQRDVFIDMYCYRRRGHNEADEPAFTQPRMYELIEQRPTVRESYLDRLLKLHGVTRDEADEIAAARTADLEASFEQANSEDYKPRWMSPGGIWAPYIGGPEDDVPDVDTGVDRGRLSQLLDGMTRVPAGFTPHPTIERVLERRREMAAGKQPLDWAAGEALALASLAADGARIRMTGQDSERGTFSHRHAVLHDVKTGDTYCPLQHVAEDQAPVNIHNSALCEAAALGFEYGYSLDCPDGLVVWEAQFGDFANVAQVIIDQFIASAEDKWRRLSGITLLLPHGFEGQGPEHSSARLERFLMLSAEHNIQVVQPTTPAQYFHVLRRQVIRPWRKPLIVLTPKSLLRHKEAVSPLDDLADGRFRRVIADKEVDGSSAVERILLCTGKLYYELRDRRAELKRRDVAIVRLEQLYPFPLEELRLALSRYADGTKAVWVQDEPQNMGAWPFIGAKFCGGLFNRLPLTAVTRPESASPATGSAAAHKIEQQQLLDHAFGGDHGCGCP